ncbi:MAG: hypothetical protein IT161_08315 [Bryobacterales bacterium]|nr:hypothetical protein [Bryobacterales bacterium]
MKRFLLWDFPRASWQYDVVVILILSFIFLIPRDFFRDQPRGANVVQLPSEAGATTYWIDSHLLEDLPDAERPRRAQELIKAKTGPRGTVTRIEPIYDDEKDLRGFMAYVKP